MRRRLLPISALAVGGSAIALAACGGGSSSGGGGIYGGGSTNNATPAPTAKITITSTGSKLGTFLTDGAKRTVYLFEKDPRGRSACSGACASLWPPLTVGGNAKLATGGGVSARLLSTTMRAGGTKQVTYAGHPLYYYAPDQQPGQITGQGLDQFGAKWFVLAPNGTAIER